MSDRRYIFEMQPKIPAELARLEELAMDLSYSWNRRIRELYAGLDRELWDACGHNPKVFLRRVSQQRLNEAAASTNYRQEYEGALSTFDSYRAKLADPRVYSRFETERDLIAYFCAEFAFHESLPLYAGGLGVLAGDHCKAASDLGLPFVAVGLLYNAGYFRQVIDVNGRQHMSYTPIRAGDLPLVPVRDAAGDELHVSLALPGRAVALRVWQARLGHVRLLLLDSDVATNAADDRMITHELYGGDARVRIEQELALGMGGLRVLRALGLQPTCWHINEGHAAFLILERMRELVRTGVDVGTALEVVAADTVFTTHTPVAAGHDVFDHDLMRAYFPDYMHEIGLSAEEFFALGASPLNSHGFNQTALALRGSRHHNGVSRIHGEVAAATEAHIWPQISAHENPIEHVTNGVHVPTFLAEAWVNLFNLRFGNQWRNELHNVEFWQQIDALPDQTFWSVRQMLKFDLIADLRRRAIIQHRRNGLGESEINHMVRCLDPDRDICLIGFARRFATYKRATLLLSDRERLIRLLRDDERPIAFIFAGRAHARDHGGQELIRELHDFSRLPEIAGRLIVLEGYDLALARTLVAGVDVWLNTPQAPMEASGTSGMKAAINGVVNLSILDGWWAEGYTGDNGFGIAPVPSHVPAHERDRIEANEVMNIIEDEIRPRFYARNQHGYPAPWVKLSKNSMKTVLPRFSSERMVLDYLRKFYRPAHRHALRLAGNDYAPARILAEWKRRIRDGWEGVALRLLAGPETTALADTPLTFSVAARLGMLKPTDVELSLLLGAADAPPTPEAGIEYRLEHAGFTPEGEAVFTLTVTPDLSGLLAFRIRMYPRHELLAHRFEMGRMIWLERA
ncbi:MAG: alpha-glucan family phosphorylase [Gammaproteobacteria bacterium]|nr:alpha-glucan family phosphorylase [Gammaproteobacteria bacterium]